MSLVATTKASFLLQGGDLKILVGTSKVIDKSSSILSCVCLRACSGHRNVGVSCIHQEK